MQLSELKRQVQTAKPGQKISKKAWHALKDLYAKLSRRSPALHEEFKNQPMTIESALRLIEIREKELKDEEEDATYRNTR